MGCCSCTGAAVRAQAEGAEALLCLGGETQGRTHEGAAGNSQMAPALFQTAGVCELPVLPPAATPVAGVGVGAVPARAVIRCRCRCRRCWHCALLSIVCQWPMAGQPCFAVPCRSLPPASSHPRAGSFILLWPSLGFVLCPPQPLASAGAPRRREDVLRQRACAAPASVANVGAVEVYAAAACRAGSRHCGTVLGGSRDPARPALPAAVAPALLCGIRLRFRGCGAQCCLATCSPGVQLRPLKPSRRRGWARSAQPTPGSAAAGPDLLPLPLSWIRLLRNRSLCHQLCLLFPFKCCHSSISWPF